MSTERSPMTEIAFFGGGCFWCTAAIFTRTPRVNKAISGYAGGSAENPTYEQVSSGGSGHAEVIRIEYDPEKVSYSELLDLFFRTHDPTTVNRQGADAGTQYRSIILYHSQTQRREAEQAVERARPHYKSPIVTEIKPFTVFYEAEGYYQDYYAKNPSQAYCTFVIAPKLKKLKLGK